MTATKTAKNASATKNGKAEKKVAAPRPEVAGTKLAKAQIRVLTALSKSKTGCLNVADIAKNADVPKTHVSGFVFFASKAKASKGIKSLLELKLVRELEVDVENRKERLAEITAAGRKILAKTN